MEKLQCFSTASNEQKISAWSACMCVYCVYRIIPGAEYALIRDADCSLLGIYNTNTKKGNYRIIRTNTCGQKLLRETLQKFCYFFRENSLHSNYFFKIKTISLLLPFLQIILWAFARNSSIFYGLWRNKKSMIWELPRRISWWPRPDDRQLYTDSQRGATRRAQRDVVYLGWPIAPSYMSPNAGVRSCWVSANEYSCAHGDQINFGDLTPFFNQ